MIGHTRLTNPFESSEVERRLGERFSTSLEANRC